VTAVVMYLVTYLPGDLPTWGSTVLGIYGPPMVLVLAIVLAMVPVLGLGFGFGDG